jgi:hypothetical protein
MHIDKARHQRLATSVEDRRVARYSNAHAWPGCPNPIAGHDHNRIVNGRLTGAIDETRADDRRRRLLRTRVRWSMGQARAVEEGSAPRKHSAAMTANTTVAGVDRTGRFEPIYTRRIRVAIERPQQIMP